MSSFITKPDGNWLSPFYISVPLIKYHTANLCVPHRCIFRKTCPVIADVCRLYLIMLIPQWKDVWKMSSALTTFQPSRGRWWLHWDNLHQDFSGNWPTRCIFFSISRSKQRVGVCRSYPRYCRYFPGTRERAGGGGYMQRLRGGLEEVSRYSHWFRLLTGPHCWRQDDTIQLPAVQPAATTPPTADMSMRRR